MVEALAGDTARGFEGRFSVEVFALGDAWCPQGRGACAEFIASKAPFACSFCPFMEEDVVAADSPARGA